MIYFLGRKGTGTSAHLERNSFVPTPSDDLEARKTGSLRLPECLVNFIDFRWKVRAPPLLRQGRQIGIFQQQRLQLQPGRHRLQPRKVAYRQLSTTISSWILRHKLSLFFCTDNCGARRMQRRLVRTLLSRSPQSH